MEIYKGRLTIDVMGAFENAEAFRATLSNMTLAEILEDADSGQMISGGHAIESVTHVHRDDVGDELQAIGNDGSFFDSDLDYAEDEDEDEDDAATA
jgi:hypothetical protein